MSLPPHDWDTAEHRREIHRAFNRWFVAFMQTTGDRRQVNRLFLDLERLCADAEMRHFARVFAETGVLPRDTGGFACFS